VQANGGRGGAKGIGQQKGRASSPDAANSVEPRGGGGGEKE